jgi:hypothetical protein
MRDRPGVPSSLEKSWTFVTADDRAALLRAGVVVLADGLLRRKRWVTISAADRASGVKLAQTRFGPRVDVTHVGDGPRRLEPLPCDGHLEREPGRLQLRYATTYSQHIDDVIHEEDDLAVVVFATVCTPVFLDEHHYMEGPVHVYLAGPLDGRPVIDGVTGRRVPYRNVYDEMADDGLLERQSDGSYRAPGGDPGSDDEPWEPWDAA